MGRQMEERTGLQSNTRQLPAHRDIQKGKRGGQPLMDARGRWRALRLQSQFCGDAKGSRPRGPGPSKWTRPSPAHHPRREAQRGGRPPSPSPTEQMKTQLGQTSHSDRPVLRVPAGRGTKPHANGASTLPVDSRTHAHAPPSHQGRSECWNDGAAMHPGATGRVQSQHACHHHPAPHRSVCPHLLVTSAQDDSLLRLSPLCGPSPPPTATMLDWTEGPSTRHTEHM